MLNLAIMCKAHLLKNDNGQCQKCKVDYSILEIQDGNGKVFVLTFNFCPENNISTWNHSDKSGVCVCGGGISVDANPFPHTAKDVKMSIYGVKG